MSLEFLKKGTSENFLLKQLIKKNFTSKYKDSVLGILWSFLNPLITMAILTVIFSALFARTIENFPVYFMAGRCILDFFNAGTKASMTSIKRNRGILQKIYVPRYIFALANICSEFLNFLISVFIMVMIMIATQSPFYVTSIYAVLPIVPLILLTTGVGLVLAVACTKFTDIEYLYKIFVSLLAYACAIFYPMDIVPQPVRGWLELNPIYGIIAQFREFVMYGRFPPNYIMITSFTFSVIIFIVGIYLFRKYQDELTLEL